MARCHFLVPHEGACECKVGFLQDTKVVSHIYLPYKTKIIISQLFWRQLQLTCLSLWVLWDLSYIFSTLWNSLDPGYHTAILQQTDYSEHIIIMIHHTEGTSDLRNFQHLIKWKTIKQWCSHLCFYREGTMLNGDLDLTY